jgi:hypothetical protein
MQTDWDQIKRGLDKYLYVMNYFKNNGDLTNREFQKKFKGFYRIRRNQQFCDTYFSIMQSNKGNKEISFKYVLSELFKFGKLEASFASKLLATINPTLPVWDKEVLNNIGNKLEAFDKSFDRINDADNKYQAMIKYYDYKILSDEGVQLIRDFDERFPGTNITAVKKIDLIFWQTRKSKP